MFQDKGVWYDGQKFLIKNYVHILIRRISDNKITEVIRFIKHSGKIIKHKRL